MTEGLSKRSMTSVSNDAFIESSFSPSCSGKASKIAGLPPSTAHVKREKESVAQIHSDGHEAPALRAPEFAAPFARRKLVALDRNHIERRLLTKRR